MTMTLKTSASSVATTEIQLIKLPGIRKVSKCTLRYHFTLVIFQHEHNMWKYLFFIAYIQNKDETEYTGIESYVWEEIEN